jgi:uncharacterized protein GlcG (DUF336 family)
MPAMRNTMQSNVLSGLAVAAALLLPASGFAQSGVAQAPAAPVPAARGPALADALLAAQTAVAACHERQQAVSVTVVDAAGVQKALLAADGASARGVASSTAKAQTALAFAAPTSALAERAKGDAALAARLQDTKYNTRAGGLPIVAADGTVIGAIGVGGARGSDNDEACAQAGLARVGAWAPFK